MHERNPNQPPKTWMHAVKKLAVLLTMAALAMAGMSAVADEITATCESAWDALVVERPQVVDDGTVTAIERRILQLLTPAQADELSRGLDPGGIELPDGHTLAELIAQIQREDNAGLVFKPVIPCTVLDTRQTDQPFTAGETRFLKLRDQQSDSVPADGCGIPGPRGHILRTNVARSVFLTVRVIRPEGEGELRIWPANDHPQPQVGVLDYGAGPAQTWGTSVIVSLCDEIGLEPCPAGDVKIRTHGAGGHVILSILGYFEPVRPAGFPTDHQRMNTAVPEKSTDAPYWEPGTGANDIYYSDGKVGIGPQSPAARLHVYGYDSGAIIQQPSMIDGDSRYFEPDYPTLFLWRGSDSRGATIAIGNSYNRYYIYSTGTDFGIYTPDKTRALTVEPDGDVQVRAAFKLVNVGEGLHLVSDSDYFGTNYDARVIRMVDGNDWSGNVDGGIAIEGYTTNDGNRKPIMAIRGSGNVGIGTKLPNSKLVVTHDGNVSGDPASTVTMDAESQSTSHFALSLRAATGLGQIQYLMRVRGDGNVGIGEKYPQSRLDVAGDIKLSGSILSDGDICIGNCN